MDNETARMQHHPVAVFLNEDGEALAMMRYYFPWAGQERKHEWIKLTPDTWVFTNSGDVNQYKALVVFKQAYEAYKQGYTAVIRTLSQTKRGRSPLFQELEDAQAWAMVQVYELIQLGFDFLGGDKHE